MELVRTIVYYGWFITGMLSIGSTESRNFEIISDMFIIFSICFAILYFIFPEDKQL